MSDNFAKDFLTADEHGLPRWVWLIVIVAGVGVGLYLKNSFSPGSSAASTDTATTSTGVGPVDTTPANPVTRNPYPQTLTVRSSGVVPTYDKSHAGPPVRFAPDGNAATLYNPPFNSPIVVTGPPVIGTNGNGQSNQWYPVGGGYINVTDVVGGSN